MLKFNNYPPEIPADVSLTEAAEARIEESNRAVKSFEIPRSNTTALNQTRYIHAIHGLGEAIAYQLEAASVPTEKIDEYAKHIIPSDNTHLLAGVHSGIDRIRALNEAGAIV